MLMKLLRAAGIGLLLFAILLPPILCENAMHIQGPLRHASPASLAHAMVQKTGSEWKAVELTATDGARLRAWWFVPRKPIGAAVILLHGVADTRQGMLGPGHFLLERGYSVLIPDSRGHGVSGGDYVTYGLIEAGDIHCWANWMFESRHVERLYGAGQSMGAAILLQSLRAEPRFRAVVADCPFFSFEEISYDRLSQIAGLPRPLSWPLVQAGFCYGRLAHGLDLRQASPAEVLRTTQVPTLLIHGIEDRNIPPRHSQMLHALNPRATRLWLVPGAGHVASFAIQPQTYVEAVTEWFARH